MNEALKLIEGMKKLKVITKKMQGNTERIQQYASIPSNERPYFSTEAEQTGEVKSLIQANEDLVKEYLNLKKRIELTNLKTQVTIGKNSYALADLLVLRRGLSKSMQMTFAALNDNSAEGRIRSTRTLAQNDKPTHVVRFYDEKDKFIQLQKWQELDDSIEQRLEVINATTELMLLD